VKMSLDATELKELEGLSDEELVSTIRSALKGFRASRGGEDDLSEATLGTPSKGGRSETTLETPASKAVNRSANDAVLERLIPGYNRLSGYTRL
jgi:hypothetical protein